MNGFESWIYSYDFIIYTRVKYWMILDWIVFRFMADYNDQLYQVLYTWLYYMEYQIICIKRIFIHDSLLDRIP